MTHTATGGAHLTDRDGLNKAKTFTRLQVFSSAMGSMRRSVNFGGEGVGGGFATHIGTACHWLTRRGGEVPR